MYIKTTVEKMMNDNYVCGNGNWCFFINQHIASTEAYKHGGGGASYVPTSQCNQL